MSRQLTKDERKKLGKQALAAFLIGRRDLAAKGFTAAATGEWEGWERNRHRNRPAASFKSQDASLDYGTRDALGSEATSLTQTFALCSHMMRIYGTYTVGSCLMKWNTGEPEIDRIYRKYWREWMPMSDASGLHNFKKQTRIGVNSTIRLGNSFGQKISDLGFGQVRLIEGDRIRTGGSNTPADEDYCVGGIEFDKQGRRTFARVWDRNRHGFFTNMKRVPWREMFHMFDTDRPDAYLGVTKFHPILNPARDYKETKAAERLASKRNSKLALLVKSIFGGAGANSGVDLFANETPTQDGETKVNVQEVNDTADAYMFPDEEIKAHTSERPSEGWRWLMEDLVREMALGMDLPFSVVYHMAGLGGPAARFEINRAARTFMTFIDDVLEPKWLIPVAGWKIAEGIEKGVIPFHPNWGSFKPQRPVYITIDLGRDSKAGIEENKAALLTATSWFEENGLDFEEETELLFQEEKFRMEMAKKYDVPIERVRLLTPNGNPAATDSEEKQTEKPNNNEEAGTR